MHYRLDNYCLMLDKVTSYLKSIGDMQRLDLVRRCFYLKGVRRAEPSQGRSLPGLAPGADGPAGGPGAGVRAPLPPP